MKEETHVPMEQMEVFRRYLDVANWAWETVNQWKPLAMDTIGKQLVRAADSIGANLIEGDGRYATGDSLHFLVIARASARETRYWIQCAISRNLVTVEIGQKQIDTLTSATQLLNRLIAYRRQHKQNERLRELPISYELSSQDPFAIPEHLNTEHLNT